MTKQLVLLAGAVTALAAGSTAVGLAIAETPSVRLTALSAASPAPAAERAVLKGGLASFSEFEPQLELARSVETASGATWTLVPTTDGGACFRIADTFSCDSADGIGRGRLSYTEVALPDKATLKAQAAARRAAGERASGDSEWVTVTGGPEVRTAATRRGVVPDGITAVAAYTADGKQISVAKVSQNVYELPVGLEGDAATIRFIGADGKTALERSAW